MDQGATRLHGVRLLAAIGILTLLYGLISWIGVQFLFRHVTMILIWSPNAISLAALILFGPRLWPAVLFGGLAITLSQGMSPGPASAVAAGDTVAAVLAATVLQRYAGFRPELDRVRDVLALLIVGGVFASLFSAAVAVTSFRLADELGADEYTQRLLIWWRSGFGRIVSLTPFLLLLRTGSPRWAEVFGRMEFWIVSLLLLVTCQLAFGRAPIGGFQLLATHLPLVLVIWAGVRLGTRGAAIVTLQALIFAVVATRNGLGPFASDDLSTSVSLLFIYNMGIGPVGPLMAAAIAQRDRAEEENTRETADRLRVQRERELLEQRERIVREMHEGLGSHLVSVLAMVQRGTAKSGAVAEGIRHALDDMRIMIDSLESSREGLRGQLGKLRARVEPLLERNGIEVEWRVERGSPLEALDAERSLHCLRIIQEAVTNTIQHARASHMRVVVSPGADDGSMLSIEVSDDGIGGDPATTHVGHGMTRMLERAREIGGEIRFEFADPGRRVRLFVPVPSQTAWQGAEESG